MLVVEVCPVAVEPIGDEHRDIIRPAVPGGGTEQYPLVILRNFVERFHPCALSNDPLLVKYKEYVRNRCILPDIVPGINDDLIFIGIDFRVNREKEGRKLTLPFQSISLSRRGDDVQVFWRTRHPNIILCAELTAILFVIIG